MLIRPLGQLMRNGKFNGKFIHTKLFAYFQSIKNVIVLKFNIPQTIIWYLNFSYTSVIKYFKQKSLYF